MYYLNMMANFGGMMENFGSGMMSWMGFGSGWFFMILFWVAVIIGIMYFVKWLVGRDKEMSKEKTALDILKERYAKSEISKEEFEEKKKDLI